jgi:hypothetical protein
MSVVEDSNGQSLAAPRGRRIVFTPERFDQIRNLVERGHSREQIAEIIGCSLGSLQVTCSREGISLRRLRPVVASDKTRTPPPPIDPDVAKTVLEPPGGWPPGHPWSGEEPKDKPPTFTLHIDYGNRTYDLPITIDSNTLCELACAANIKGVKITDMISQAIAAGTKEVTS